MHVVRIRMIPVEPAEGGFRGINLHYLPPILRAKFLDALLDVTNNKKYDDTTKFRLTYDILNGARKMRYFKPCFKKPIIVTAIKMNNAITSVTIIWLVTVNE